MLSKIIVSSYAMLLEIAIWLLLIGSFVGGWIASGFLIAVVSLISTFVFCVVFFGAFLALIDIQKSVREIAARKSST